MRPVTFLLCQYEVGNNTLDDDPILRAEEYFHASALRAEVFCFQVVPSIQFLKGFL